MRTHTSALLLVAGLLSVATVLPASASERRFTYTYGSDVLNPGTVELEPWTTFRMGRSEFYNRMEHRLEFEFGLTDRLQMAWYLKMKAITLDEAGTRVSEFEWGGVSSEWKYKLMDAVADPVGLALYFEPGIATAEAELEFKLIVDKRLGDLYLALNTVFEYELEFGEPDELEKEAVVEVALGATWFFTPTFAAGVEIVSHTAMPAGEGVEYSAIHAGPAVSYSTDSWWATFTILPQLAAPVRTGTTALELDHAERLQARLLLGIHL